MIGYIRVSDINKADGYLSWPKTNTFNDDLLNTIKKLN